MITTEDGLDLVLRADPRRRLSRTHDAKPETVSTTKNFEEHINDKDSTRESINKFDESRETERGKFDCTINNQFDNDSNTSHISTPIPQADMLFEGQEFDSYDDFIEAKRIYEEREKFYFSVVSSAKNKNANIDNEKFKYEKIRFICQYGRKIRPRGRGIRPNQQYNGKNCTVKLSLLLREIGGRYKYKVGKFQKNHNDHPRSEQDFNLQPRSRLLDNLELKTYVQKQYLDLQCRSKNVRKEIEENTGKVLSAQDLINAKRKVTGNPSDIDELLKKLDSVREKDPNSFINLFSCEKFKPPKLNIIFCQLGASKELFEKYGKILLVDGTYNLTNLGFITLTICCIDNFGVTHLLAWALIANEDKASIIEVLNAFKEANSESISKLEYIMLDKDFCEINALFETLPFCHFLICQWHAKKAVERKIMNMHLTSSNQHVKYSMKDLFNKMIHEATEEKYMEAWQSICSYKIDNESDSQEVLSLIKYLDANWHEHRDRWSFHKLKHLPLRGTLTNNRSENLNMLCKEEIPKQSKVSYVVNKLLELQQFQRKNRKRNIWTSRNKTFMPSNLNDITEQEVVKLCSTLVDKNRIKDVLFECKQSKLVKQADVNCSQGKVKCTRISGPCHINEHNGIPCRHIIFTRNLNKEDLISAEMFFKEHLLGNYDSEVNTPLGKKPKNSKPLTGANLTIKKRYAETSNIKSDLATLLNQLPDNERLKVASQIETIINAKNEGKHPVVDVLEDLDINYSKLDNDNAIELPKRKKSTLKISGHTKCFTKRKKTQTNTPQSQHSNMLTILNKEMRSIGQRELWCEDDLLAFINPCWLRDLHFQYFLTLLKRQFPEIKGLNLTQLYNSSGYPAVSTDYYFIQPCHSGSDHWTMIENKNVPPERRHNTVNLYDSFIHYTFKTKNSCDVPSAIEWQICQLLATKTFDYGKVIEIRILPCHQQSNGYDCGVFAIANCISVAFGYKPEEIFYCSENMRPQLLDMLKKGSLEMVNFGQRSDNPDAEKHFKRPAWCGVPEMVTLPVMIKSITIVCFCFYPESYDHTILCDKCSRWFHQKCHFLGHDTLGKGIGEKLKSFLCFECRLPGDYAFLQQKNLVPNCEKISECSNLIRKFPGHKLLQFLPIARCVFNKNYPSSLVEYFEVEKMLSTYDINCIGHFKGEIYAAVKDFYVNNFANSPFSHVSFESLRLPQLIHFSVLLVCDAMKHNCPPLWPLSNNVDDCTIISDDSDLDDLGEGNANWLHELQIYFKKQSKEIATLCSTKKHLNEVSHKITDLKKELKDLTDHTIHLVDSLNQPNNGKKMHKQTA